MRRGVSMESMFLFCSYSRLGRRSQAGRFPDARQRDPGSFHPQAPHLERSRVQARDTFPSVLIYFRNFYLCSAFPGTRGVGGTQMQDREGYRKAAGACLEIANSTTDHNTRTKLLVLASNFFDMATSAADDGVLAGLIDGFNESQMRK